MVVGHTDATGDAGYNLRLSERRAAAAEGFLTGAGMRAQSIRAVGMGESEPIATNETEVGQQENRRVEVAIYASEAYKEDVLRRGGS